MKVLGIETSCDETAVSIIENNTILSEQVYSQTVHESLGGVVPELASRDHIKKLYVLACEVLDKSGLAISDIDAIAVTAGPGLPGSLIIGVSFAKAIALMNKIPIIAINHLEGHVFGVKLSYEITPPFLALLVSGGHTELIYVHNWGDYKLLGTTRDDAAGEALDKAAKVIGLSYPGGPEIQKIAEKGDPRSFRFPIAMLHSDDFDFSFSGLKTAFALTIRKLGIEKTKRNLANILASYQDAIVDSLLLKLDRASKKFGINRIVISGGVAASKRLREKATVKNWELYMPETKYCTDNASMIALAGEFYLLKGQQTPMNFPINSSWMLGTPLSMK